MADHLRTELVLDALDMAIAQRHPTAGLVHHSDHGWAIHQPGVRQAPDRHRPGRLDGHRRRRLDNAAPRASSPPWNANCLTGTTGQPARRCGAPCSTSSRSSTTANAATRPWTTPAPPPTSASTPHQHQPHSNRVHQTGAAPHPRPSSLVQRHSSSASTGCLHAPAITDEASPFALPSTRNHRRRAVRRGAADRRRQAH